MTPENMTILTVDDTPANIRLLTHYLHKQGYKVITAEDGFEGFKAAIQHKPDLILLDVMMPGTDGYEVCELLKTEEETRDIPVVFLTAKAEVEDRIRGFEMGAVDYITKPFNLTEIAARVRTQLELRYYRRQSRRLLTVINDSSPYFSLGVILDNLLSGAGKNNSACMCDEEKTMNSQIVDVLEEVASASKLADTWCELMDRTAAAASPGPLYQLLDDSVDLVRKKHTGPLSIECEKPDIGMMVNVNTGLTMQALAEIMTYTASRTHHLEMLEICTSRQTYADEDKPYCCIDITAVGDRSAADSAIAGEVTAANSPYTIAAAVASVRSQGGRIISQVSEDTGLKFSVALPA